jgi:hypothetical protein
MIPILENWYIGAKIDPYMAPESIYPRFCGNVYNHPDIEDGAFVVISYAKTYDIKTDELVCVSRRYKLGKVDEDYEKTYPNAKSRTIDHLLLYPLPEHITV